ncbi:MAG: ATP-grasp domain-containing protein [Planctomycetota bacterium]|nr:ATP-grasp domain-containing protein [Planctomycetota bacterium]
MRVALTYNLKRELEPTEGDDEPPLPADFYAECDSPETVTAIRAALETRHETHLVEADEDSFARFRTLRPDIVFNVAEGVHGRARESHVPCMLEMLRIPYTGSDPLTLALCLDKARCKEILQVHGIPTPRHIVIEPPTGPSALKAALDSAPLPAMVKPLFEGSSKGIKNKSLVKTRGELRELVTTVHKLYRQPAIVEEFLPGREFTVALIGNGPGLRTLPIVEIKFDTLPPEANPIYSFEAKWVWDTAANPLEIFKCPAEIPDPLAAEIADVARRAFVALGCRDWCRIDVRLDGAGRAGIIEINPLPGILPRPEDNSCFPKAARAVGLKYEEMILTVLDEACRRCGLPAESSEQRPRRAKQRVRT